MQGVELDAKIVCDKYQVGYRLSPFAGIYASNFTVESLALVAAGHKQFWLGQTGMDVVTEVQRKHRLETDPRYSVRHDIEQVDIIQHRRVLECGVTLVACAVVNGGVALEWSKAALEDSRVYHYACARDDTYPGPGIPWQALKKLCDLNPNSHPVGIAKKTWLGCGKVLSPQGP
uniref:Uncharacterized protein n=1 Tax=Chromera velia CCMP2878 TaxID=1169474 RepID=A0A0G4IB59_9ALVE|eukprot:Cvel_12766.t1-p1 / transcript=Cvel_12766.t1 / gene=Cvel_12766 / organism=Chromera_velia_CCMP2878 / gene_product=hypothetical protein / transcript_product=hypothetical protein / location=Cvel_scaffold849:34407-34925(+) / protein_length=173 / sequence_SO=supercontig / SO=protein_coding / is_pseudo=false